MQHNTDKKKTNKQIELSEPHASKQTSTDVLIATGQIFHSKRLYAPDFTPLGSMCSWLFVDQLVQYLSLQSDLSGEGYWAKLF